MAPGRVPMVDLSRVEIDQNQCFVTNVYEVQLAEGEAAEALNGELLSEVHAIRARGEKGLDYAGAGWQTPHDLHERPAFAELFEAIHVVVSQCSGLETIPESQPPVFSSAWANVESPGDFVRVHLHPWSIWSGAYYVTCDERSGDIYFEDPRPASRATVWPSSDVSMRSTVSFTPTPGKLVLFPSWLEHYTDPNRSQAERVCIAFNVDIGQARLIPDLLPDGVG